MGLALVVPSPKNGSDMDRRQAIEEKRLSLIFWRGLDRLSRFIAKFFQAVSRSFFDLFAGWHRLYEKIFFAVTSLVRAGGDGSFDERHLQRWGQRGDADLYQTHQAIRDLLHNPNVLGGVFMPVVNTADTAFDMVLDAVHRIPTKAETCDCRAVCSPKIMRCEFLGRSHASFLRFTSEPRTHLLHSRI